MIRKNGVGAVNYDEKNYGVAYTDREIKKERKVREAAEAVLQKNIEAEAAERKKADKELETKIIEEAQARENADDNFVTLLNGKINKHIGTSLIQTVSSLLGEKGTVKYGISDIGVIKGEVNAYYILSKINTIAGPKPSYELVWERLATETMIDEKITEATLPKDIETGENIEAEAAERKKADKELEAKITEESQARETADDNFVTLLNGKVNKHIGESLTQTVSSLLGEKGTVKYGISDIGVIKGDEGNAYYILSKINTIAGPKSSYELVWERLATEKMLEEAINSIDVNSRDLYGTERIFKCVLPKEIPEPYLTDDQDENCETMKVDLPEDIHLYIDDKEINYSFSPSYTAETYSTDDSCVYLYYEFDSGEIGVYPAPPGIEITSQYDEEENRIILAAYKYSNIGVEFKTSPDRYVIECNAEYTSPNADDTGDTYTIAVTYGGDNTKDNLLTNNKYCFLDAVNELCRKLNNEIDERKYSDTTMNNSINARITGLYDILGTLSAELDEVNG